MPAYRVGRLNDSKQDGRRDLILDLPTLMIAVAVANLCCAVARIVLYRLHPGMAGLGHWAAASIAGAVSFAIAGLGAAMPGNVPLSLTHGLIILGFCLVWDGFKRFLCRGNLPLVVYGGLALVLIVASNIMESLALRAGFNSVLICVISTGITRELLWKPPPHRLAMRLAGWVYATNAVFFLARALSIFLDIGYMAYGVTAIASLWWLCVTVSVTLCMVLMAGERLQEELNEQASRDPLTGVLNRRAFTALAERDVALARRGGQSLAVLMMDLDHFKQVNDLLGHSEGDEALCRFVAVATHVLRTEDLFCRYGGEEFLAFLPGSTAQQALAVAERVRMVFAEEARSAVARATELPFAMTVSVGISELAPGEDLDRAVRRADSALYAAKAAGRNCCKVESLPPVETQAVPA